MTRRPCTLLLLAAAALAACDGARAQPCGTGFCPPDYVCAAAAGGGEECVVASGRCAGHADGERCEGDGRHLCIAGACVVSACDDGFLDADSGEVCDDPAGNSDAPNAACRPTTCVPAACGDGVVDGPGGLGEVCDDGALNSDLVANACRTSCRPYRCGDGVVDGDEAPSCLGPFEALATWDGWPGPGLVADLDGDGRDDVITAFIPPTGVSTTIVVFWGRADGGFDETRVELARAVWPMAAGDPDGDGFGDVILIEEAEPGGTSLLRHQGGRDLTAAPAPVSADIDIGIALVDLDGDDDAELITVGEQGVLRVRAWTGAGFGAPVTVTLPGPGWSLAVTDVTWDGQPDALVAGDGALWLAAGVPGGFGAPTTIAPSSLPDAVDVFVPADVDGDGQKDVVIADEATLGAHLRVYRSLGGGAFGPPAGVDSGAEGARFLARDLDGDRRDDLVAVSFDGVRVLRATALGTLVPEPPRLLPARVDTVALALADPDRDGFADLVVADQAGAWLARGGDGPLGPAQRLGGTSPSAGVAGELDEVPGLDLVLDGFDGGLRLVHADARALTGEVVTLATGQPPGHMLAADLDGDGRDELVRSPSSEVIVERVAGGALVEITRATVSAGYVADVAAVDLRPGPARELAVIHTEGGVGKGIRVYELRPGTGLVSVASVTWAVPPPEVQVGAADVDGDGAQDLLTIEPGGLVAYRGTALGLEAAPTILVGDATAFAVADLDGDGRADLVADVGGVRRSYLQLTTGLFVPWAWSTPADDGGVAAITDLNHDGRLDLVAGVAAGECAVAFGDGHGGFSAPIACGIAVVAVADVTGDGRRDLVGGTGDLSRALVRAVRVRPDARF
jgi:hypothetical protein